MREIEIEIGASLGETVNRMPEEKKRELLIYAEGFAAGTEASERRQRAERERQEAERAS